jgi:hypothetical protein
MRDACTKETRQGRRSEEKEKEEENHDKIKVRQTKLFNNTHGNMFFLVLSLEQIVIKNQNIS